MKKLQLLPRTHLCMYTLPEGSVSQPSDPNPLRVAAATVASSLSARGTCAAATKRNQQKPSQACLRTVSCGAGLPGSILVSSSWRQGHEFQSIHCFRRADKWGWLHCTQATRTTARRGADSPWQ